MKKLALRKLLSAAALAVLAGGLALTPQVYAAQTLLWSDEFNGTSVNTNNWSIYDNVADGTNCFYIARNLVVTNGELIINNKEESYVYGTNGVQWTGGGMECIATPHPQYSYLEARVRISPTDTYTWPTWWTIGWDTNLNKSIWPPEFDICEYQGPNVNGPGQSYHDTANVIHTRAPGWTRANGIPMESIGQPITHLNFMLMV